MIKFEVKNRFSGEVQFVAKINCYQNAALSLKLGLAVKWAVEIKADLREADLRWANLCGADLRWADLREADLLILQTPIWTVYIQKETIRIGCQYHKVSEWENFNDEKIAGMHIDALAWWKKYREPIFALHKTLDGK